MTLKSTGNEVFLYHTPRDRPMSRHPLLLRDTRKLHDKSELADVTEDGDQEDFQGSGVPSSELKLQDVFSRKYSSTTIKEQSTTMPGKKPLPKFLPPMCRTYIDLLKFSNKERQNITSKAQSERLAKVSQVERGARFIEKLKQQYPDRVQALETPSKEDGNSKKVAVSSPNCDNSAKEKFTEKLKQEEQKDLVSIFLMRNKIINESVGSDDGSSASSSPEPQPDQQSKGGSSNHKDSSNVTFKPMILFDALVFPSNSNKVLHDEAQKTVRRKFSVPVEHDNLKEEKKVEAVDFKQALLSFRKEATSKSKDKKKTKNEREKKLNCIEQ